MRNGFLKKVYIHAYLAGNFGDDLMVRVLCERYPKTKFLIYANESYKKRYKDILNLKVYSPVDRISKCVDWIVFKIKKTDHGMWKYLLKSSDATVYIGGSIFVQHFDDFRNVYGDLDLAQRSKKAYVVGANFGPYTDEKFYESYKDIFLKYEGVCFRDTYSKELFKDHENIRYAPDVVFNYKMMTDVEEKKQVLFSVISLDERNGKFPLVQYSKEYYHTMASLAETFIQKGYKVQFVSFCKFEKDEEAIQKILDLIPSKYEKQITKLFYDKDHKQVVHAFAESEIIVGTRFHSIILGWLAQKKVLPIVYNEKITNTLKDNEIDLQINISEMKGLTQKELEEKVNAVIESTAFCPDKLIKEAESQFSDLDKFLQ